MTKSDSSDTYEDEGKAPTAPRSPSVLEDALFPVAPVLRLRQQPSPPDSDAPSHDQPEAATASGAQASVEPSDAETRPARPRSKARRTSVPSWDEIVFGAKQD